MFCFALLCNSWSGRVLLPQPYGNCGQVAMLRHSPDVFTLLNTRKPLRYPHQQFQYSTYKIVRKNTVLTHSSCYNKILNEQLRNKQKFISYSWENWEVQDQGSGEIWCLGRTCSLDSHIFTTTSSGRRGKLALWGLLQKSTNPNCESFSNDLITSNRPTS